MQKRRKELLRGWFVLFLSGILRCIIPILGIPALVVGISAIKKLGAVRDIGTIRKWGVAVLLLAGLIAGVIMLVMKEDDLYDSPKEAAAAAALKRRQAMGYGAYLPSGYDAYGGYYDAEGGYHAADGSYYPPGVPSADAPLQASSEQLATKDDEVPPAELTEEE